MTNYKVHKIWFLLLLITSNINAQSYDEIIKKYSQALTENNNFQADLTYEVFKGETTNETLEKLSGVTAKLGGDFYSKIGPTEFLYKKGMVLKVSNAEKGMILTNYNTNGNSLTEKLDFNIFEKFDLEKLENKKGFWLCHLKAKQNGAFTGENMQIHINKKTYFMTKQIVCFSQTLFNNLEANSEKKLRLEITYQNHKPIEDSLKGKFLIDSYVLFEKNNYKPVNEYKNYKVHSFLSQLN